MRTVPKVSDLTISEENKFKETGMRKTNEQKKDIITVDRFAQISEENELEPGDRIRIIKEMNDPVLTSNVRMQMTDIRKMVAQAWEDLIDETGKDDVEALREIVAGLEDELSWALNSTVTINWR